MNELLDEEMEPYDNDELEPFRDEEVLDILEPQCGMELLHVSQARVKKTHHEFTGELEDFDVMEYDDTTLSGIHEEGFGDKSVGAASLSGKPGTAPDVGWKVHTKFKFTKEQKEFLVNTLHLQTNVLNSREFKDRFMDLKMSQTSGMNNREIYAYLMSGSNNYDKRIDYSLDYYFTLYDGGKSKTIGSTLVSRGRIKTNSYFFNRWLKNKENHYLSGHLFHEYTHACGFIHRGSGNYKRRSVPYMAGYLMRDLCKEVMSNKKALRPFV